MSFITINNTKKEMLDYLKDNLNITKGLSKKTKEDLLILIVENQREEKIHIRKYTDDHYYAIQSIKKWLRKKMIEKRYKKIEESKNKLFIFMYVKQLYKKSLSEDKLKILQLKMNDFNNFEEYYKNDKKVEWKMNPYLDIHIGDKEYKCGYYVGRPKFMINDWYNEIKQFI